MKDIIVIVGIIVIVVIGNMLIQNVLHTDSEEIIAKLEGIKEQIENEEDATKNAQELNDKWEETNEKWAMIVIHQELDSIKTAILGVKSGIESGDTEFAYQQLQNAIFLVGHIKEKIKINSKNIF